MATPIKLRVDVDMAKVVSEAKKSGDAVDDMAGSFEDASDASKDFARNAESAGTKAGAGVGAVGDAADAASGSFDGLGGAASAALEGDVGGAAQSALGAVSGLAGNIPGIGTALSAAAAIGTAAIGFITGAFDKAKQASDAARDSAYNYGVVVDATGKSADIAGRIAEITKSTEDLKNVQDIATISGWRQVDVIKAMATGDGLPALYKAFEDGANSTTIASKRALELEQSLQGAQSGFAAAASAADLNARALYDLTTAAGTATGEVDDLGNAVYQLPDGKQVVVNADTQKAYSDIDAFEKKQVSDKSMTVKANVDDSSVRSFLDRALTKTITVKTNTVGPVAGAYQWSGNG
jgi:hypothetical protein